jgi:hypothetical protein
LLHASAIHSAREGIPARVIGISGFATYVAPLVIRTLHLGGRAARDEELMRTRRGSSFYRRRIGTNDVLERAHRLRPWRLGRSSATAGSALRWVKAEKPHLSDDADRKPEGRT